MVEALIEPGMRLAGRPLREVVVSIFFVEREDGPGEAEEATNRVHDLFSFVASSFGSNSVSHET